MATKLTTIFGNEIKVYQQPRQVDRQYVGFPGAHGLAAMSMGSHGSQLVITGTLASSGSGYDNARSNLQAVIDDIEEYLWAGAADYSFAGTFYLNVLFDKFQLIPDADGKAFHWTAEGYVTCNFVCFARILI